MLAAIHAASFDEVWSAQAIGGLLAAPGTFALVDTGGDGFILVRAAGGESEVLTLAVRPAARRRGIAAALLAAASARLEAVGAAELFLEVNAANNPALALYFRAGFQEIARRPGYYAGVHGTREDAIVLRTSIPLSRV
jgi:ribosomal-protein-alanine N-acetyltransferase